MIGVFAAHIEGGPEVPLPGLKKKLGIVGSACNPRAGGWRQAHRSLGFMAKTHIGYTSTHNSTISEVEIVRALGTGVAQ